MSRHLHVALIVASVRPDRLGSRVAAWIHAHLAARSDITVGVVDLMDFDLPAGLDGSGDTGALRDRLGAADAFVVATPEYNHGYPGYLKTAIDSVGDEWQRKALGLVSYGGGAGGARSAEQLRQVFAELDVVTVPETVTLVRAWNLFDDGGRLRDPAGPDSAIRSMLDALLWWGHLLRDGRRTPSATDVGPSGRLVPAGATHG